MSNLSSDSAAMTAHPQRWMARIRQNRRLLVLLAAGSLAVMPGAVIAPVLPEIVQQLRLDRAFAGYLVSAHYLTIALFSPLLGLLADRTGRIRVLVASLVLFALFGASGALAQSFMPMLLTRGLLGAATGGIAAASLGLLARMYTDEAKRSQAIAYASSTITMANIAYPLLAGLVGSAQWQFAFYLYGIGLPLAGLVALFLREDRSAAPASLLSSPTREGETLVQVLRRPQTLQLLLTLGLSATTAYATVIYLPLYLKATLHAPPWISAIVLASQAIGAAVASAVAANGLARYLGTRQAIAVGLCLMATSAFLIPQFDRLYELLPVAVLFGVGLGIVVPNHYAALATLTPMALQATVLATATGTNFLGQFFSPTLFGLVLQHNSLSSVFYAAAAVALFTGLLLLLMSLWQRSP